MTAEEELKELRNAYEKYMQAGTLEDSEEAYNEFVRVCEKILPRK